jgi:hypothetical protein
VDDTGTSDVIQEQTRNMSGGSYKASGTAKRSVLHDPTICMCGGSDKKVSDAVRSRVVQDRERVVSGCICKKMSGTVKLVMAPRSACVVAATRRRVTQ